jgi:membrane protease YdiL (CAAX protease family)
MAALAWVGLGVALLGAPLLSLLRRWLDFDPVGWTSRLALWALAAVALAIAVAQPSGLALLGLAPPGWTTLAWALLATVVVGAMFPLALAIQRRLGFAPTERLAQFKDLAARPLGYRVFIVVTAGVTEELMYRGYAIGVGGQLLGGVGVAAGLSLIVFTVAHYRWGLGHLIGVLLACAVLTALFVATGDLWACMLAHALVDAVGLLLAPWQLARRTASAKVGPSPPPGDAV